MNLMQKENKMGTMPINKLLISVSLPMMISMLVQAMYNIVDSIFISHYSLKALTAVNLTFPFQNLMISVAVGTGVGINALLSRRLGEKDFDGANRAATHGILLNYLSGILFAVIGIAVSGAFFRFQSDDAAVINYGRQYMGICSGLSVAIFGQVTFERLLQSTGKTIYTMITQGIGAIINIIFDPILIFGYFGFPEMGAAGAAAATVFGQAVAMVLGIIFNIRKNKEISLSFKGFKLSGDTVKRIYGVGVPSMLVASIGSVMTFGINKIFSTMDSMREDAINVFGIYFKLQSFAFMPLFGLNNGMVPIIAYNLGARKRKRITSTIKFAVIYAEIIMIFCMLIMQIFPDRLYGIFKASDNMLRIGRHALRVISISYPAAAFGVVSSSVFQACGHAVLSMLVSLVRQLCVLLPVVYIIAKLTENVMHVWYAFPIAEIFSFTLCIFFTRYVYKKEFEKLPE